MEEKIERILNVTNYQDHPTNQAYKVFHFDTKEKADFFSQQLDKQNIQFETDEEFARGGNMYLFAVRKTDLDKVKKINYLTLGNYRKPFVASKFMRWIIVLLGFGIISFAMVSYFMNK